MTVEERTLSHSRVQLSPRNMLQRVLLLFGKQRGSNIMLLERSTLRITYKIHEIIILPFQKASSKACMGLGDWVSKSDPRRILG